MKTFRFAFGQMNNPWLGKHFFPTVFATEMNKFPTYLPSSYFLAM